MLLEWADLAFGICQAGTGWDEQQQLAGTGRRYWAAADCGIPLASLPRSLQVQ